MAAAAVLQLLRALQLVPTTLSERRRVDQVRSTVACMLPRAGLLSRARRQLVALLGSGEAAVGEFSGASAHAFHKWGGAPTRWITSQGLGFRRRHSFSLTARCGDTQR